MTRRTQITLTDAQYTRLCDESARTGLSLAELIRRTVDEQYGPLADEDRLRLLDSAFGAWSDRSETGAAYVERVRSGTKRRLHRGT